MFGNMSRRLANALALADLLRLGAVVVPQSAIFHGGIFCEKIHTCPDKPELHFGLAPGIGQNPIKVLLVGNLLSDLGLQTESAGSVYRAWEAMRGALLITPKTPVPSDLHLTIHVRGGDVFGPENLKTTASLRSLFTS